MRSLVILKLEETACREHVRELRRDVLTAAKRLILARREGDATAMAKAQDEIATTTNLLTQREQHYANHADELITYLEGELALIAKHKLEGKMQQDAKAELQAARQMKNDILGNDGKVS